MFKYRPIIIVTISIIIGLVIIYFGYHLFELRRAGQLLTAVIEEMYPGNQPDFPCLFSPIKDENLVNQLKQSEQHLVNSGRFGYESSHVYLQLGRVYCLMGEPESAVEAYSKYVEFRPKNPLGYLELGFALEFLCLSEQGGGDKNSFDTDQYVCADEELQNSIISAWENGGTPTDFYEIGKQYAEENRLNESLQWYKRALALDPEWSDPYFDLGFSNEKLHRWEEASRLYHRALEIDKFRSVRNSDVYVRLGILLQRIPNDNNLIVALEMYDTAIEIDNFSSFESKGNAYYKRAEVYNLLGRDSSEVIANFESAISIYPKHHWARLKLGSKIYEAKNDFETAVLEIEKAIELWPNDHQRKWPFQFLGDIYSNEGRIDSAILAYEKALSFDPNSTYLAQRIAALMEE